MSHMLLLRSLWVIGLLAILCTFSLILTNGYETNLLKEDHANQSKMSNCCSLATVGNVRLTTMPVEPIFNVGDKFAKESSKNLSYNLTLCLSPIFGNLSTWLMLTEMIEHYKIQGVEHFYIYIKEMDDYSRRVLNSYIKSGEVEAVFVSKNMTSTYYSWQLPAIADCLHRSRKESRYVIFQDLDERITPSFDNETLINMTMELFAKNPNTSALIFRPRWILKDRPDPSTYTGESTLFSDLPTLAFRNTSGLPPEYHTAKCIVNPAVVSKMSVHYPLSKAPGYSDLHVDPARAIVRHYRDVFYSDWATAWLPSTLVFGNYTYSEYPEWLQVQLVANVKKRLEIVY